MEITIRLEEEKDYRNVEEVTREAFWNLYRPGCDEHLLVHLLRSKSEFVRNLDFVATFDGKIIGNIVYVEGQVIGESKKHRVLIFGPVSVLPEFQGQGVGAKLINHTSQLAKEMGYNAIVIYGDIEYYKRFGFKVSKEYRITNQDGKYPAALLAMELYPDALKGVEGVFDDGGIYSIDEAELQEFDKGFPFKEKEVTKSQERFLEIVGKLL